MSGELAGIYKFEPIQSEDDSSVTIGRRMTLLGGMPSLDTLGEMQIFKRFWTQLDEQTVMRLTRAISLNFMDSSDEISVVGPSSARAYYDRAIDGIVLQIANGMSPDHKILDEAKRPYSARFIGRDRRCTLYSVHTAAIRVGEKQFSVVKFDGFDGSVPEQHKRTIGIFEENGITALGAHGKLLMPSLPRRIIQK